ncbi:MAG: hypothetical protein IPM64_10715 [Phycisphaerales bacterium]|nr:hypothetical protein [Phycisphaerales bacterium]
MPVEVAEKFESRLVTTGSNPSVELRYAIRGTDDDVEARSALVAASPALYDPWGSGLVFLPRDQVTVLPVGEDLWDGIVRYGTVPATNESTFSFDTGGGSQHITQSRQTIASYAPAGQTAPDFRGAIGVTADSVEGVDIAVPVYQFAETHYKPDSLITPTYKGTLFALTGRTNNGAFKGFAAGEVLFLGAAGSKRGLGDWEITYRFAASPNVTGVVVGEITGIDKKGWEYLWVRYADSEDTAAKALVKKPVAAYVERVYEAGDFSLLGI